MQDSLFPRNNIRCTRHAGVNDTVIASRTQLKAFWFKGDFVVGSSAYDSTTLESGISIFWKCIRVWRNAFNFPSEEAKIKIGTAINPDIRFLTNFYFVSILSFN